jgi:hypothetical protein
MLDVLASLPKKTNPHRAILGMSVELPSKSVEKALITNNSNPKTRICERKIVLKLWRLVSFYSGAARNIDGLTTAHENVKRGKHQEFAAALRI